ncbi:MAG: WG repeat-containing protein [Salibacteraceae bacterium]
MKKIILSILTLALSFSGFCGKLDKAYEALSVFNYFEAKRLFEKSVKKDTIAAGYGLSVIYSRKDNPFHQPDSALKFVLFSYNQFPNTNEKEQAELFAFGIDAEEINAQLQRVSELFLERAKDSMTTKAFNAFLLNHPWYKKRASVITVRDSLAFNDACKLNTWQAFESFFTTYPNAYQISEAKKRYLKLYFLEQTRDKSIESYASFAENNPMSPHREFAENEVYRLSITDQTPEAYHRFVLEYPDNANVEKAWLKIYQLSIVQNTSTEIEQFIVAYPDYPFKNDALMDYSLSTEKFYPFTKDKKWGFIGRKGKVAIPPKFDWVNSFSEGSALVGNGHFSGYINKRGKITVPIIFEDGGTFKQGYAWVETEENFGLINNRGVLVLDTVYDDMGTFSENRLHAQKNGLYGFYNEELELVIPFQYQSVRPFVNGLSIVKKDGKFGVIDIFGNAEIPFTFDYISILEGTTNFLVDSAGLKGLFTASCDTVLPVKYQYIGNAAENRILIAIDGKYGYCDNSGKEVIKHSYSYTGVVSTFGSFKNGTVKYISKGKYGIIDSTGGKVYPAIFGDVGSKGKLTAVEKNNKWGYADDKVKLVIKYKYEFAGDFINGLAKVKSDGLWGVINENDEIVIPIEYDDIEFYNINLLKLKKEGKWGIQKITSEEVFPFEFDKIEDVSDDLIILFKSEELAYYSFKLGRYIFKPTGF